MTGYHLQHQRNTPATSAQQLQHQRNTPATSAQQLRHQTRDTSAVE